MEITAERVLNVVKTIDPKVYDLAVVMCQRDAAIEELHNLKQQQEQNDSDTEDK